jgi:copper chaperone CopZ
MEGLACGDCADAVEKALRNATGVKGADIKLSVQGDVAEVSVEQV